MLFRSLTSSALEEKDALGKKISEDMEVEMKALNEEAEEVKAEMEIFFI